MLFAKRCWAVGLQWQLSAQDAWPQVQMAPILQWMFAYCVS